MTHIRSISIRILFESTENHNYPYDLFNPLNSQLKWCVSGGDKDGIDGKVSAGQAWDDDNRDYTYDEVTAFRPNLFFVISRM